MASSSRCHQKYLHLHHQLLLLLHATSILSTSASFSPPIQYSDLCGSVVPQSPLKTPISNTTFSFSFNTGYFTGADEFLGGAAAKRRINFRPKLLHSTTTTGTLKIEGTLSLLSPTTQQRRSLTRVVSIPKLGRPWGLLKLELSGFWSEQTGRMCLVGRGVGRKSGRHISADVSAVFKLNLTRNSNLSNTFVVGSLESLDSSGSSGYFGPVLMMVYVGRDYDYSLMSKVDDLDSRLNPLGVPFRFPADYDVCLLMRSVANAGAMKLEYSPNCGGVSCGPFDMELPQGFVFLRDVQCDENGRLHLSMLFSDDDRRSRSFDPARALVGEGFWDGERSRFAMAACRLRSLTKSVSTGSAIGDCGIVIGLWFPRSLSIRDRSLLIGQIWSGKRKDESGYFEMISIRGSDYYMGMIPGLRYNFTKEVTLGQGYCLNNNLNKSVGRSSSYPDRSTFRDLTFGFSARDSMGSFLRGSMSLFSIGEVVYDRFSSEDGALPSSLLSEMNHTTWNVSYKVIFNRWGLPSSSPAGKLSDMSAEGVYDLRTGYICLMGCRVLPFDDDEKAIRRVDSMDCQVVINIQLPSVDRVGEEHVTGVIRSMRQIKDPLYFKSMKLSSHDMMYQNDVVETRWRMDVEITMALVSLTLSCIFIGLQLLHVWKNPELLPKVSLMMLLVLTLGHMIPLMLNLDALFFRNGGKQNVLLSSGGLLEANEVVLRMVMTMAAFLLQLRLVQVTWSARLAEKRRKELWNAERRSMKVCLPLYCVGMIVVWLFDLGSYNSKATAAVGAEGHDSLWGVLIIFSGLVLDGFLLPQILFNVFWDSKEKSLAPGYYIGTTAVRALPHLYDVYRARSHIAPLVSTYVYASPREDLFSAAWDIVIPFGGILLGIILHVQQKFGGRSVLPPRFRKNIGHEVVAPIGSG